MATKITEVGQSFSLSFSIAQEQVDAFAVLSGDNNPIHTDPDFAKATRFGATIAHGILTGSIFSKIFGTMWPGEGTIYVSQSFEFKLPAYTDRALQAQLKVIEIQGSRAVISTKIVEVHSGKVILDGTATILNKGKICDTLS